MMALDQVVPLTPAWRHAVSAAAEKLSLCVGLATSHTPPAAVAVAVAVAVHPSFQAMTGAPQLMLPDSALSHAHMLGATPPQC